VVDEVITYVLRDLRDPKGGFYSAEDADSEGIEGKFYAWTPEQINLVLGDDAPEFLNWYGVDESGNFDGLSILWRPTRGDLQRPASVELSRQRLFQAREMRIRPGLDDKVLAEWNGLMLGSLAEAALATSNHRWLGAAIKNAEFLQSNLRRADGRWLRSWQPDADHGAAAVPAFAADLAALVDGFTRLAEAAGDTRWLVTATETADQLVDLFWDNRNGGVFTTGVDAAELISRPKDITDNAVPSANSASAVALLRLAALTGNNQYRERASEILTLLAGVASEHPLAFGNLLAAFDMANSGFSEVVVPGEPQDLLDAMRVRFLPNTVVAWGDGDTSALWAGKERGKAYVCRNYACAAPATTPEELSQRLDEIAPTHGTVGGSHNAH
ncbi:MAG: thioredoxin domain-containing protein, partial [Acidimicrobiales bacterium]